MYMIVYVYIYIYNIDIMYNWGYLAISQLRFLGCSEAQKQQKVRVLALFEAAAQKWRNMHKHRNYNELYIYCIWNYV